MNIHSALIRTDRDIKNKSKIENYTKDYLELHNILFVKDSFHLNLSNILKYICEKSDFNLHSVAPRRSESERLLAPILRYVLKECISFINIHTISNIFKIGLRVFSDSEMEVLQNRALTLTLKCKDITEKQLDELVVISNFKFTRKKGILKNKGKRIKIAFCISGQLREFACCKDTWNKLGINDHEVDCYIHTWSRNGRRIPDSSAFLDRVFEGEFLTAYKMLLDAKGYEYIKEKYPSLIDHILSDGYINLKEINEVYNPTGLIVEDDSSFLFDGLTNQRKMLYGIQKCYDMVKASNKKYDLIVRMRPDRPVDIEHNDLDWGVLKDLSENYNIAYNIAHTYWLNAGGMATGDQFLIAVPDVYEIYSRAYNDQVLAGGLNSSRYKNHQEGFLALAKQLYDNSIRLKASGIKLAPLSDPSKLKCQEILELISKDLSSNVNQDPLYIAALQLKESEHEKINI